MSRVKQANRIVGAFTVFILVLMLAVITLVVRSRGVGRETFQFVGEINGKDINGIEAGTKVVFLGQNIGKVIRLDYPRVATDPLDDDEPPMPAPLKEDPVNSEDDENDVMLVIECVTEIGELEVQKQFYESPSRLKRNLKVRIKRQIGGVGAPYLEVALKRDTGNGAALPLIKHSGLPVVFIEPQTSLQEQITDNVKIITERVGEAMLAINSVKAEIKRFQEQSTVTMGNARETMTDFKGTAKQIDESTKRLEAQTTVTMARARDTMAMITQNADRIEKAFDRVSGSVEKFRLDTRNNMAMMHREFELIRKNTDDLKSSGVDTLDASKDAITDLQRRIAASTERLNRVLDNTQRITAAIERETRSMPGVVRRTQDTLKGTQEVVEGMRENFLVKPFVSNPKSSRPVTPSASAR